MNALCRSASVWMSAVPEFFGSAGEGRVRVDYFPDGIRVNGRLELDRREP